MHIWHSMRQTVKSFSAHVTVRNRWDPQNAMQQWQNCKKQMWDKSLRLQMQQNWEFITGILNFRKFRSKYFNCCKNSFPHFGHFKLDSRAVTVPPNPFSVRFHLVFQQKTAVSVRFLVTYLPFQVILNRESTNAVSGKINFGLIYYTQTDSCLAVLPHNWIPYLGPRKIGVSIFFGSGRKPRFRFRFKNR